MLSVQRTTSKMKPLCATSRSSSTTRGNIVQMNLAVWAVLLTSLELATAYYAPRAFFSRLHGLGSTTNGPRRRHNWEFAFGGQHQWHHRRTTKDQRSDSGTTKQQLSHNPNSPATHSPRFAEEVAVVVVESSTLQPPPKRENLSLAPFAAAASHTLPLQVSVLPAPTVYAIPASLPAATPLLLVSNSSSSSSMVHHRPDDYAWAAMDVWHMQCALHHARSAAAEDEVPVSLSIFRQKGAHTFACVWVDVRI